MSTDVGKKVLLLEAQSIQKMAQRIGKNFQTAVALMHRTKNPVILIGMGKPAFIADKISASLASTGTSSFTLHPADALHGDIGRIKKKSVVLLLSNSGETEELVRLLPILKELKCSLIAITGNTKSYVAKFSDVTLDTSVVSEAKPLDVAP
ncbi:MAG: SIS domain-containing protein, partial [Candidatus Omnitrophica bacterium]|nr:SIS domain-containing protein [Candidatus Omnitrophota bacterium]